jgi:hypothetical protein
VLELGSFWEGRISEIVLGWINDAGTSENIPKDRHNEPWHKGDDRKGVTETKLAGRDGELDSAS